MRSCLLVLMLFAPAAFGEPPPAPKVSPERPGPIPRNELVAYEKAIAPYVFKARATFPYAKRVFLAGLPEDKMLVVFRWWQGKSGKWGLDQISVSRIVDGTIRGRGARSMKLEAAFLRQEGYKVVPEIAGNEDGVADFAVEFPETELLDWAIIKFDGAKMSISPIEGNYLRMINPN